MNKGTNLLLHDARLPSGLRDVLIRNGRVFAIGTPGSLDSAGIRLHDLEGRWTRPGLWDEHVHFTQWVIRRQRIDLGAATSAAHAIALVRDATRPGLDAITGYGFRDGLWPDKPTRAALDHLAPDRPVVLISGDLHCGWMNSRAAAWLGVVTDESGMLREAPWMATLDVMDRAAPPTLASFKEAADAAARRGVVGIVDFENADNATAWPERVSGGVTSLRVEASIWPDRLDDAIARGLRTGAPLGGSGLVHVGHLKIIADGSLNTRTALCFDPYRGLDEQSGRTTGVASVPPEQLRHLLDSAHRAGIVPAVHAIGDRAVSFVLDELERGGKPGRIEHAQLVAAQDMGRFGRSGLLTSVQPEHAMDDRDVADRYWPDRTERTFPYRSLYEAGAQLRFGSDAPVAPLDPWQAISAATHRSRDDREPWHVEQRLPIEVALAASSRGSAGLAIGDVADLVVLDEDPATASVAQLRNMPVSGTMLGGRWTWGPWREDEESR